MKKTILIILMTIPLIFGVFWVVLFTAFAIIGLPIAALFIIADWIKDGEFPVWWFDEFCELALFIIVEILEYISEE